MLRLLNMAGLTVVFLLAGIIQAYAVDSYSQSTKLTLNFKAAKLETVLGAIEDESEFFFLYNKDLIDVDQKVDISAEQKNISEVLDILLEGKNIKYFLFDRQIVLSNQFGETGVFGHGNIGVQQGAVRGKITDTAGLPLPGVTVVVKGTTQGTITDSNGEYSFTSLPANATLVFSFVGMRSQEVVVGNQTTINVTMEEETIGIEEVVAIGYGTQKKVNLTGAVSQVTAEVLESRPITNIGQGLQGTISNLNITQTTGTIGAGASFNIRGYESINGGDPLILVNGVPMNINRLNPQDIESVSVLKDAASAAIYGARAAYGVILITTKSGKKSVKPEVQISANYGMNTPTVKFETFDVLQRADYMNRASMRTNGRPYSHFEEVRLPAILAYVEDPENNPAAIPNPTNPNFWWPTGNTNWSELLQRDFYPQQQYSATISGGTENLDYYASISYYNEEGINKIFNEFYERYNVMANLNWDITSWARVGTQIAVNNNHKLFPPNNSAGHHDEYTGAFQWHQWANFPVYTPNGKYFSNGSVPNAVQFFKEAGHRKRDINDIWMTINGVLKPVKNVVVNVDYSNNIVNQNELSYWKRLEMYFVDGSVSGYFPYTNPSQVTKYFYNTRYYTFNAYGTYENTWGLHNVKFMVGFNQENQHYQYFNAKRDKLIVESMPYMSLAYGERVTNDGASEFAIRGAFTRLNYVYADKYLLEFNGRYDGSSKFPKDNRFAFFPSISVGWRLEQEPFLGFMKNTFDMFKLRGSYGSLGNQAVPGTYPYLATYSSGQVAYLIDGSLPMTLYAPGLVSPTLTWETVTQQDIGVDIAMFDNRLNITADVYRRDTKDMLTKSETKPAVLAVAEPNTNAADLKTVGWDLTVDWRQAGREINWGVKLLLSDYVATITDYSNPTGIISDWYIGKKVGEIWGLTTDRIAQTDEEARSIDQKNISGRTRYAGDLLFKDLDGDGKITRGKQTLDDHGDMSIIGNDQPRYSFGLNTDVSWKNFDLGVFFQGIAKRDYWINTSYWIGSWNDEWRAHSAAILDYWTPENTDAFFPHPIITGGTDVTSVQTRFLQNSAYCRLKELTLGYTLPSELTQRAKINKIRVYLSGNNVWEVSGIYNQKKLIDPEMTAAYQNSINRTFSVGANIYF